jgi:3-oxoacyl-[acyl-carrier-protein] synthase-1
MGTYIAGIGINSVLGNDFDEIFNNLKQGKIGYSYNQERKDVGYQVPIVGKLRTYRDIYDVVKQAYSDVPSIERDYKRVGLIVSCDSNVDVNQKAFELYNTTKNSKSIPTAMGWKTLNSGIATKLSNYFGIGGLSITLSAACAGGAHAIGLAKMYLENDMLDYVVVVGYQELGVYSQITFDSMRLFSKTGIAKPFDENRNGLIPSGGSCCMILTKFPEYNNYGEIAGYGYSTGLDILNPDIASIKLCMNRACHNLNNLDDVVYVSAHATGTKLGDAVELTAIDDVFGKYITVTSTKALTGHECWMSGISEIIYTIIQVRNLCIVKQHNYEKSELPIAVTHIPTEDKILLKNTDKYILSNSFGFGGTNASILLNPWKVN